MNINIGGGHYDHHGWRNFDATTGFKLAPDTSFPVPDGSVQYVYSSHCFEHLDDATVYRMLTEARRMLRPDGMLVLKLPDFEEVLRRWRAGDDAYFKQWGMDKLVHMWPADTIDARAAMIFCGYWNDAYGDEFTGERRPNAPGAYHGPAIMDNMRKRMTNELRRWSDSCYGLAKSLRYRVPAGAHFNHRNAWSRAELKLLLESHGFEPMTTSDENICTMPIPGIRDQRAISMYISARGHR